MISRYHNNNHEKLFLGCERLVDYRANTAIVLSKLAAYIFCHFTMHHICMHFVYVIFYVYVYSYCEHAMYILQNSVT